MSFNPGGGGGISSASDIAFSNPANNDNLTYNSTTQKWVNKTAITSTYSLVPTIYAPDGTNWFSGTRPVPSGYTGRVIWDSADYPGHPAPDAPITGDRWRYQSS